MLSEYPLGCKNKPVKIVCLKFVIYHVLLQKKNENLNIISIGYCTEINCGNHNQFCFLGLFHTNLNIN